MNQFEILASSRPGRRGRFGRACCWPPAVAAAPAAASSRDPEPARRPRSTLASTSVVNPSDKKGGTLKFANSGDWDSLDPGETYYGYSLELRPALRPLAA